MARLRAHTRTAQIVKTMRRGQGARPTRLELTAAERDRLSKKIERDAATGCWIWNGKPDQYGEFSFRGVPTKAHRLMMHLYSGDQVPWDAHVHHECGRRGCVNPGHLRVVTASQHADIHRTQSGRRS